MDALLIISKQDHSAMLMQFVCMISAGGRGADWLHIAYDQPITCCQGWLWK